MKSLAYLFLFFLFWALFSCVGYREFRYEYLNKQEIAQIKNLYLLGVEIEDKGASEANEVLFYSSLFVKESFLDSFLEEFNKNSLGLKLSVLPQTVYSDIYSNLIGKGVEVSSYRDDFLLDGMRGRWIFENHTAMAESLEKSNILSADGVGGYVIIKFQTSVWEQNALGFFKVYDTQGRVIWREQIRDFSPYIVSDSQSPYLIRNRQMKAQARVESTTYYQELRKIYLNLGKILSVELIETLE